MPTKIRRVDFYPDDWLAGTIGLSDVECGIYIRACALIYARGGAITVELLRRACSSHGRTFNLALERLEKMGKLERNLSEINSKRCQKEIERASKRLQTSVENGAKGGRPNGLEKAEGFGPTRARSAVPVTTNNLQTTKENPSSSSLPSSARAPLPNGGAEHARGDENGAWRKLGNGVPLPTEPPPPTPDKVKRAGEHYFFLISHGRPGEAEGYLDALDVHSQLPPDEIFNAVEARMSA